MSFLLLLLIIYLLTKLVSTRPAGTPRNRDDWLVLLLRIRRWWVVFAVWRLCHVVWRLPFQVCVFLRTLGFWKFFVRFFSCSLCGCVAVSCSNFQQFVAIEITITHFYSDCKDINLISNKEIFYSMFWILISFPDNMYWKSISIFAFKESEEQCFQKKLLAILGR